MLNFKNLLAGVALTAVMTLNTGMAQAATIQTGVVQGLIYMADTNAPADNATVTVTCNSVSQNTMSDASGFYFVQFGNGVCKEGDTATVTAVKGSMSGTNTGVMANAGQFGFLRLDLTIVHVPLVPEFGLVTGAMAAMGSIGAFTWLRRRSA